jgi:DNA-binding LacI/PurR family transcriptional regulator
MEVFNRMSTRKTNRRLYRDNLADALRHDIVDGKFQPGDLIPTRVDLLARFNVAPATLQAAMHTLLDEGFIAVSASRYGTRVADHPPHLYHYVMVLPPRPHFESQYYKTLVAEAARIAGRGPMRISVFEGVAGHDDFESYSKITENVKHRRIKGVFFSTGATEYKDTPLLTTPGIPRFAVGEQYELPTVPKAQFSLSSFFERAASYLQAQGRRRPAILAHSAFNPSWQQDPIRRSLESCGLEFHSYLLQYGDVTHPESIRQCMQLLLQLPAAKRPDSLIIADDNLVEPATGVLKAEGGATNGKLTVVAHANFPIATPSQVPAVRLGFDVSALLQMALSAIDAQSEGRNVPMFRQIPAVFEHELPVHTNPVG